MKDRIKFVASLLLLVLLALLTYSTYTSVQKDTLNHERSQAVAWEKQCKKKELISEKLLLLKGLVSSFEKKVGKVDDLGVIDQECLPAVVEYRFSKYCSGPYVEELEDIDRSANSAIDQVLFAQELLKDAELSKDYPNYRSLARDKTSFEISLASRVSASQCDKLLQPYHDKDREISNLTWEKIQEGSSNPCSLSY